MGNDGQGGTSGSGTTFGTPPYPDSWEPVREEEKGEVPLGGDTRSGTCMHASVCFFGVRIEFPPSKTLLVRIA